MTRIDIKGDLELEMESLYQQKKKKKSNIPDL
jgi:hypothetical protein